MKSKQKRLKLNRGVIMIIIGIALLGISLAVFLDKFNYHILHGRALMAVTYSGGLCSDGPCESPVYNLYNNGRFEGHKKLSSVDVSKLRQLINSTDFTNYRQKPKPNCPSFVDGSDRILIFPGKHGSQKFTVCKLDIPSHDSTFSNIEKYIVVNSAEF